jgi:hypothetical protein
MKKQSNKNALVHGVYSSDVVMPWEKAEEFNELLKGIRLDFMPNGTTEDDIVFGIADLCWKKRRINRMQQLAFLQSRAAAEIEKSGKRSVSGIRRSLEAQRLKEAHDDGRFAAAVVDVSDVLTQLTNFATSHKNTSLGKFGANLRSAISTIEALQPFIEAGATALAAAKPQAEEKVSDGACNLDTIARACAMEERLDGLIEKKIKQLIIFREYQRQYGHDSSPKLIEHHASSAKDVSAKPAVTESSVTKASRPARTEKSKSVDDHWADNDNNNDNNDVNPDDYDWENDYDEALADKKARQKRRARKG